jgi:hypothetical protein
MLVGIVLVGIVLVGVVLVGIVLVGVVLVSVVLHILLQTAILSFMLDGLRCPANKASALLW